MTTQPSRRFIWAVEVMSVEPQERILEVGCGHGIAAQLICERLTGGTLTAIDQSSKMIKIAHRRNQQFIEEGSVTFQTASVTKANLAAASYDTIFAINVNDFWTKPGPPLAAVRRALSDQGQFYLFYETPSADRVAAIENKLVNILTTASFDVVDKLREGDKLLCVIARKAGGDSQP